jgi:hypothetical protein
MRQRQIILAIAIFLVGRQTATAQQFVPPNLPQVAPSYLPTTAPPGAVVAPPYLQPSPTLIQPAPAITPFATSPGASNTVVPLPSQTPGSIFGPPLTAPTNGVPAGAPAGMPPTFAPVSPLADIAPGGLMSPQFGLPAGPEAIGMPTNLISVPVVDDELAWDQIADVVSDYFPIAREQRARRGDVVCEGRIDTAPQDGATWLEPHRGDSVGDFNRWESTFQTIRRRAIVRVIPDAAGYLIEVVVEKELEDLPKPMHATAGAATFPHEGSLPSRRDQQLNRTRSSPRWIPLGRDPPLEQRMLADIHARLSGVTTPANSALWQR